jgi:chaperonin GroES
MFESICSLTPDSCRTPDLAAVRGLCFLGLYPRPMSEALLAIQMLHDRILIKVAGGAGERTTRAGILIPATAEVAKRLVWGEVAGVGQHVRSVKLGERVLFSPEDQYEVEVGGETYLVLRERDLQAVASERAGGGTGLYL